MSNSDSLADTSKGLILVVEDDLGIATLERRSLEKSGYTVITAMTADAARSAIQQGGVDLMVLDYMLPCGVTGLEFLAQIKSEGHDLPVIMATGMSDETIVIAALRLGVRDFVIKSTELSYDLPHAVERIFVLIDTRKKLAESEARLHQWQQQRIDELRLEKTAAEAATAEIQDLNDSLEQRVLLRTQELEEKVAQLALTSKYKSEFLANMSHELRTPLNGVLVLSEMLAENDEHNLSEQQLDYLKMIHGSGKDLLALINDILDLTKIESGQVTLELQEVSFAEISLAIELNFRDLAESHGLVFSVELATKLPPSLYTDLQRLQQIMKNLISNAFKFTVKGQVLVRIAPVELSLRVDHDGISRAETVIGFFVTDSGIGVAEDKQKIIFEAFQQADTGSNRKYGGTGLGLSIARELAWLLGGELRLAMSEPDQGSTFVLYLPLRAPEPGQGITIFTPKTTQRTVAAEEVMALAETSQEAILNLTPALPGSDPAADLAASLAGKKVLVVDDVALNIFIISALLLRNNMVVIKAENGHAALEQLVQNPDVDIVLMDILMPVMDGYEAMAQIRQMKQFESLPIIALTANALAGDREKCIAAGASDYLSKPVNANELFALLRVLLFS